MYPHLFSIGDFTVTSFGLMMFLAFVGGAWVLARQFEQRGLDPEDAWDMLLWVAIGGIAGAKLYYVGLHPDDLIMDPVGSLTSRGGLVWYGGFIGGVAAFWWQTRKRKLPLARTFDSAAPALALGYAIGRMGCFLVGDDYGRPTDSWVGIAFPEGYPPTTAGYFRSIGYDIAPAIPDSAVLAVIPTQLFEIAAALVMFGILWKLSGTLRAGRLFAVYLVLYGIERFIIEFFRAKTDYIAVGLTTSQVASVVLLVIAAVIWRRTADTPEPDPSAPAADRTAVAGSTTRNR
ncbi:MAG: prolipoprotein diacylglyceryl transferase [Longimicrobiales bacterium]|nr:prolipoprotein diacylglyceryl transferase [Longimicrobiales bacterium]